ncbi:MAG: zinc ribbon domain-containing protein [Promethearchaeota archaeon]
MSMARNNNSARVTIGLLIFVYLGFVFFMPNMNSYPIFKVFPGIFIMFFIVSIATITSNKRRSTANRVFKNDNQVNTQNTNPYRAEYYSQKNIKTSQYQRVDEEIELKPIIRFCQFCGAKIERDAMFCHSCGSKLE